MPQQQFCISMFFCILTSLSFISCFDECEQVTINIINAADIVVTESNNTLESVIIDTFFSPPQYVKVSFQTDAPGFDPCITRLGNPIKKNDISVTFNKDVFINFNTSVPPYTNLTNIINDPEYGEASQIFYDAKDFSKVFIALNQDLLVDASFQAEQVTVAYHMTTLDGIELSDSTTVVLDY